MTWLSWRSGAATGLLSHTVCEIFSVKLWRDLEIWVRGHSRSLEMALFNTSHTSSYWRSTVTMALSCIISEMKRDIGGKSPFLVPPAFDSPVRGFRRNIAIRSGTKQLLVLIQYTNVTANRTDRHRATAQVRSCRYRAAKIRRPRCVLVGD